MNIIQINPDEQPENTIKVDYAENYNKLKFKVTDVYWERINVFFSLESDCDMKDLRFFLVDRYGKAGARPVTVKVDDRKLFLTLNVTNSGNNSTLCEGQYRLAICNSKLQLLGWAKFDDDFSKSFENISRTFLYRNRNYAYIVSFFADEENSMRMHVFAGSSTVAASKPELLD